MKAWVEIDALDRWIVIETGLMGICYHLMYVSFKKAGSIKHWKVSGWVMKAGFEDGSANFHLPVVYIMY